MSKEPPIELHVVRRGTPQYLDTLLRRQARAFDYSWERLEPLITEAKTRQIHNDLGFKSWPAYIADVAHNEMPNVARSVEQRRQIVALMAGEGMSQRAIADAVGVNHATISRDQAAIDAEQVLHDATPQPAAEKPATITGRDGNTYTRPDKDDVPRPKPPNTYANRFYRALAQLQEDALKLEILTKGKGFAEHLDQVCKHSDGVVWAQEIITRILGLLHTDQGDLFSAKGDVGGYPVGANQ